MGVFMASSEKSGDERRARERASVAVELKLHAPEHHFMLLSRTVDLSSHGAFVRTNRPLPIGSRVVLAFPRGKQRNPLKLEGEVVRAGVTDGGRSSGIAIRFSHVSDLDESLLKELIDKNLH